MISYVTYKAIHYFGIFLLVATLGGAVGASGAGSPPGVARRWWVLHGVALFLVLLAGFGLLARLGVQHGEPFPLWIWIKLTVWVVLGGALVLLRRRPRWAPWLLGVVPAMAALAGYVAFTKP